MSPMAGNRQFAQRGWMSCVPSAEYFFSGFPQVVLHEDLQPALGLNVVGPIQETPLLPAKYRRLLARLLQ